MKKKISLMLMGVLAVSQISAFAYTTIQHGTRTTVYGSVYAGDTGNKVMTNYTLKNINARGVARIYVPGHGYEVDNATHVKLKALTTYTFNGNTTPGTHTHSYTEGLTDDTNLLNSIY